LFPEVERKLSVRAVVCTNVVYDDMHTQVRSLYRWMCVFRFCVFNLGFCVFFVFVFCVLYLGFVFSVLGDWLRRASLKWPILYCGT